MNLFSKIYYAMCNGWVPKEKVLTHHLTHILAGVAAFFALTAWGWFDPLGSALVVTGLALFAEVAGLFSGETWDSSAFDMVQYTFCWPFYFTFAGDLILFAGLLIAWVVAYITILLLRAE